MLEFIYWTYIGVAILNCFVLALVVDDGQFSSFKRFIKCMFFMVVISLMWPIFWYLAYEDYKRWPG